MAGVAASPTQTSHVARPIPAGLVPVAVLLAAAAGLLALLPSLAQAVWEVPHLVLLGLVISFGVFTQRTAADGNANVAKEGGSLAWNARYHPDDPLVVVADHAAPSDDDDYDDGSREEEGARERPISLPVRRLRPAAASAKDPETGGDAGDGLGEETDTCASSSGFWAGARAAPSPPSVLDADLGLSPCSQPPQQPDEQPFSVHTTTSKHSRRSRAATATPSTVSRAFVPGHYHPSLHRDLQAMSDDGEVTDWDEDADADGSDAMTPVSSSERSVRGRHFTARGNDHNDGDDTSSVDEELLKLATKAEPDVEEEVDRKADEFIAKFREQIRLQRH